MNKFLEIFNHPIKDFKSHLDDEDNERIIFSGIYGIGKTTFINHFFNQENQREIFGNKKYKVFFLTPVNYSISSNEDIFSYIKSDLIFQLLAEVNLKIDEKFQKKDTLAYFIMNNIEVIGELFKSTIPKIEKKTIENSQKVIELINSYSNYHRKINTATEDYLKNYNLDIIQREGSLYEFNPISEAISKLILVYKEQFDQKTVLIIDDLDRIDPAHIFRIFNVFASHFDYQSKNDNKFGFDKLIFVCDINNIRKLFQHNYGSEVDFSGYIDKFYSKNIFHYNIRSSLVELIGNVLRSITYADDPSTDQYLKGRILASRNLLYTIKELIVQDRLNLRSFFKFYEKRIGFSNDNIPVFNNKSKITSFPAVFEIKLLAEMYDDAETLINALDYCRKNITRNKNLEDYRLFSTIVYFLDSHQNQLMDGNTIFTYVDSESRIKCGYKLIDHPANGYIADIQEYSPSLDNDNQANYQYNNLLYYQLLMVKHLKKIGYL